MIEYGNQQISSLFLHNILVGPNEYLFFQQDYNSYISNL